MMAEAEALDREILASIEGRRVEDFDALALRIFAYQLRTNAPYARYCRAFGVTLATMPNSWREIPPVPTGAFQEADLCTFDPATAALVFETSGTTAGAPGKHYMETTALYDAALLAAFHDAFLRDLQAPLRYLLLVPDPKSHPHSSLGYMMQRVAQTYGAGEARWYLEGDRIDVPGFIHDVRNAQAANTPVLLAATAFALVHLLDALRERNLTFPFPPESRIMETGGFKGRARAVDRFELYAEIERVFAVPQERIISEYGMTELSSQYYDDPLATLKAARTSRSLVPRDDHMVRLKVAPPWLRSYAVGADAKPLPGGTIGALVHVDLANRSSCVAVQTEDLGAVVEGAIILIGRDEGAELRGCSLDAEWLRVLRT